ncbi:parallel beta helix pectate lyase-like protein [Paraburkholderia sp. BL18I3N2]|uniref:right-handed parallel beta-helix repeat-containing protein n=1 Tax=unclassified Paraburkholderia TaxID=2615204 RepID=UPI000D05B68F|nr:MULTISPECIES: right-handed parallel beta-helix repeat-containing protein [unclassified Paraburkholderia]PRX26079.1 parallel beta helix pectate lyase-like protein [Paraburkholderia sp. BL18I3N2]PRX90707.1 parallel beta helix pectate lyase-like protein [Paraburkholderia sp. BL25I1N1]
MKLVDRPEKRRSVVKAILSGMSFLLPSLGRTAKNGLAVSSGISGLNGNETIVRIDETGARGNGVDDDTDYFTRALHSNVEVVAGKGKVYRVQPLVFVDLKNAALDLNGSTLLIDRPTPTGPSPSGLTFKSSSGLGGCQNLQLRNGKIAYVSAPATRIDNNFAIYAEGVQGIEISEMEIDGSWSAGIWVQKSTNVYIHGNYVHRTKADGITCQGCGANIRIISNRVSFTGDDCVAVTWFTGNDESYVGNTSGQRYSLNVTISDNTCEDGAARGIFLGGVSGGEVSFNKISRTDAIGILLARDTVDQFSEFFYAHGVNNSNLNVDIHHNSLNQCAIASNSRYAEVGGIWISERNRGIRVMNNILNKCNNIHFYCAGNAEIYENKSFSPQWIAGGRVRKEQMLGRGSHVVTGANSASKGWNFGRIYENELVGDCYYAIWVGPGSLSRQWQVTRNRIFVSTGTSRSVRFLSGETGQENVARINAWIRTDNPMRVSVEDNVVQDLRDAPTLNN